MGPLTPARIASLLLLVAIARASAEEVREVEPNDHAGAAMRIAKDIEVAATVKTRGDRDFFRLEVERPVFLRIEVTAVDGVDFELILRDAERRIVAKLNGQPVGRPEALVQRVRRGALVLEIAAHMKSPLDREGPYVLTVATTDLIGGGPTTAALEAAVTKGLGYLASRQRADGSWGERTGRHGVTGLALLALVGEGRPEDEARVEKAVGFFRRSYVPPGRHPDNARREAERAGALAPPSAHFMYEQAIAVLALSERLGHRDHAADREMVGHAVRLLLRSQATASRPGILGGPVDREKPHYGGWRYVPSSPDADLSVSGWCLIAMEAAAKAKLEVPPGVREAYMTFCRRCFDEERSAYAYQPGHARPTNTTNATGVLTTLLCVGGKCPVVRHGLRTIRESFPTWEAEGRYGRYPFNYWYYASRALYLARGDAWKEWQTVIGRMLLVHQNEDGSWDAAQNEERIGKDYTTALAVLILQLCAGNPPSYLDDRTVENVGVSCPRLVDDIEKVLKEAAGDDRTKEKLIREILGMIDRYREG